MARFRRTRCYQDTHRIHKSITNFAHRPADRKERLPEKRRLSREIPETTIPSEKDREIPTETGKIQGIEDMADNNLSRLNPEPLRNQGDWRIRAMDHKTKSGEFTGKSDNLDLPLTSSLIQAQGIRARGAGQGRLVRGKRGTTRPRVSTSISYGDTAGRIPPRSSAPGATRSPAWSRCPSSSAGWPAFPSRSSGCSVWVQDI